jgi:uncharacterized membrane protein
MGRLWDELPYPGHLLGRAAGPTHHLTEGTRDLTWIHLGFLFAITMMPLSTRLLAEFITYRSALAIYWLNICVPGAMLYWRWAHAIGAKLVKDDTPEVIRNSICRRILIAQSLYAAVAARCFVSNWMSIVVTMLVQLNHAVAPRLWRSRGS